MTSEKKTSSSRPTTLARKQTPQYVTKVSSSASRQRREEDEERGRDSGESFPQFWYVFTSRFVAHSRSGKWNEGKSKTRDIYLLFRAGSLQVHPRDRGVKPLSLRREC